MFGVIGNPIGVPDFGAMTYKLTSPGGHNVGELTNDTFCGDRRDSRRRPALDPAASDRAAGLASTSRSTRPSPTSARSGFGGGLSLIAPAAAGTALDRLLDSFEPVAVTLCTRFRVRELKKPIGFCNDYFDTFEPLTDVAAGRRRSWTPSTSAPLHIQRRRGQHGAQARLRRRRARARRRPAPGARRLKIARAPRRCAGAAAPARAR